MDRDTKFARSYRDMLEQAGTESVVLLRRSPNLTAYIERFFRSLKSECLSMIIFFGGGMLRRTVRACLEHYHQERNHQGLENQIIQLRHDVGHANGEIQGCEPLGGLLRYYDRDAAWVGDKSTTCSKPSGPVEAHVVFRPVETSSPREPAFDLGR